ncbi:hypothetical protein KDD93_09100 [Campylobacter sp. faydin G-24]|uniref:Uncharacterized protein n=1 Tax=Campylobacter anatolicus TaxID=2829105 RepID=A0ABS5HKB0_9BACT|nr:hypothetical protein [Campylobacter anatolicus]MBR8464711.1 hypothetical protein [Campylobacter anatolicus]
MFLVLNRIRGEYSYFAKINAVLIALLIFAFYENFIVAICCGLGYLVGESKGWGVWVGALVSHSSYKDESENKFIEQIACKFFNPQTHWLNYCRVCLFIRGLVWWLPVFIPLMFVGVYIAPFLAVALAIGFLMACELGYRTRWITDLGVWQVNDAWGRQEVFYGAMQDIAFIWLFLNF